MSRRRVFQFCCSIVDLVLGLEIGRRLGFYINLAFRGQGLE